MSAPSLTADRVAIRYRLTERLDPSALAAAHALLSAEEKQRHDEFRQPQDRRDYTVAHALLRSALSDYMNIPTDKWTFRLGSCGKPELSVYPGSCANLTFNLSHTRGMVTCAIAPGMPIGVDVVRTEPGFEYGSVASRYLSAEELVHLYALPARERSARFMELWALKEAYTKATGRGLSEEISNVGFLIDGERIRFLPPGNVDRSRWQFGLLTPAPHFRIALAIDCRDTRQWTIHARSADDGSEAPVTQSSVPPVHMSIGSHHP